MSNKIALQRKITFQDNRLGLVFSVPLCPPWLKIFLWFRCALFFAINLLDLVLLRVPSCPLWLKGFGGSTLVLQWWVFTFQISN